MIIKGTKINDRYEIIRLIGEGGMANVYLAYDPILERQVAVKILRGDLANDEKFVRRFQREAISASSLNHSNIVEMYDVGEDDGKYFIVMEYIDGRTLKSLIKRRGALTLPEVVDIMSQLTSAVAHAHDSYIIHRDIKPQNVLILTDGRLKITDFGIAIALNDNELTQTNSVLGSVHYLPPEQANGSGSTIKSDIYSLGILMFELLTGKIPFRGENAVEIAIKQLKEKIPSVRKFNPEIPQSIENIILKACAKNPRNRYDNVREMLEDIQSALLEQNKQVKKVVYKYCENDLDETKIMKPINLKEGEDMAKKKNKKKKNIMNIVLLVLGIIASALALTMSLFIILLPKFTKVKEIKIPNITNLTVIEAEKKLKDLGLIIKPDLIEDFNDEIEEGLIINTRPEIGRSIKIGTEIELIVSLGLKGMILEDYTGKNVYEITGILESKNINVLKEKKDVDNKKKYKENVIIDQNPEKGTKVSEGDTVTLIIPNIVVDYPDFVNENWTENSIQTFADEYGINLLIEYKETNSYEEGTIISQSRQPETPVVAGAPLKIIIAIPVVEDEEPDPINDIIEETDEGDS